MRLDVCAEQLGAAMHVYASCLHSQVLAYIIPIISGAPTIHLSHYNMGSKEKVHEDISLPVYGVCVEV